MIRKLLLNKVLLSGAVLLASAASATPAFAWWDGGHMIVAEIAYERLTPKARLRADELVKRGAGPQNNTFVTASCWADDLKEQGVHFYDTWHYAANEFHDGAYSHEKPEGDLLWAMSECQRLLLPRPLDSRRPEQTPTAVSDDEQARALRFLIHLVGDIHMPLHAASRYSPATPKGDRGGNDYKLAERNLHAFWDSGAGLFAERIERPFKPAGQITLRTWTNSVMAAYPAESVPEWKNHNFDAWTEESFALVRTEVYQTPVNRQPSPQYVTRAQDISKKRLALAGYRLAALLNDIFDPQP
jgi:hypothetical protein